MKIHYVIGTKIWNMMEYNILKSCFKSKNFHFCLFTKEKTKQT